jgi:transcription elongation factor Elf1
METLTREFILPSNGIFGVQKVTVRPMSTKEEKLIYTSRDQSYLEKIVKSCIVEPKDITVNNLHSADITYLLYMIREMTFGPNYSQQMQCPNCNSKQDIEIDITEMQYNILDLEDLEKKSTIKLPQTGDTIKIKLISHGRIQEIHKLIQTKARNEEIDDPEGYEYIYRFAALISEINGEEVSTEKAYQYLDNLNLVDFNEIKKVLTSIKIGLINTNMRTCKNCGEEVEVIGVTVPEFFRTY